MLNRVIKLLATVIIIVLVAGVVYPPVMPDLMNHKKVKGANVTVDPVKVTINEDSRDKAYDIVEFLDTYGNTIMTKKQLDTNYETLMQDDRQEREADMFDTEIGYVEWSTKAYNDSCADGITVDSDMGINEEEFGKFNYVLDDHMIYWYCKEHGEIAAVSPYKNYETEWCREAEKIFPGIGEWLKSVEDRGYEVETTEGQKVNLVVNDFYGDARSKNFDGFVLTLRQDDLVISMSEAQMYAYEGLTEQYLALQKSGWQVVDYFTAGADKGFACKCGYSDYAPLAKLSIADGRITRIDLTYCDYKKIDQNMVKDYQKALQSLFHKAGIDDSVKDVLNDKGKKENYKVYTEEGETNTDYRGSEAVEFDTFMISIYDIQ